MSRHLDLAYILPLGYSPALETEYISPCKTGCECSTRRAMYSGTVIEARRYTYDFSWLPYKRLKTDSHPFHTQRIDCSYKVCTGCHKPATMNDAMKINRVLGFEKPVYKAIEMDLDWTLSGL